MARFFRFLLCMLCALITYPASSYPATDNPLGTFDPSASEAALTVSRTSPDYTSISLNSPNIVTEDLTTDYSTFQAIGIPGEPFIMQDGSPAVPQVTRFYRIPNTGSVDLILRDVAYDLVENVNSMPVQMEESRFGQLKRNESVYGKDSWYPEELATVSSPMILRDFRIVVVTLHPVQVNPVTHQARVYHTLNVDLVANDTPGVNELTNPRQLSSSFLPIYRTMIANLDETSLDDSTTTPGGYLILCKEHVNSRPWADSLALWKKRCGYDVVVESRATWTTQAMITYIRNAYSTWASPPEFVCILGDPSATSFGMPTDGGNWDHSFALGNAGDDLEDIGVGRLCGNSNSEMMTINAKIMGYERNPWMQTATGVADTMWFHKGFFYCSTGSNIISNWIAMQWGARQFANYTGVTNNFVDNDNGVNETIVRTQINGGVSIFIWRGSVVGEMSGTLAASCNTTWRLPIVMTVTCGTGDFEGGSPDVSESWLLAGTPTQPKGGICGIGTATLSTHAPQNVCFAGGLMYSMANAGVEHIGHAVNGAKTWLYATFNDGSEASFSRYNNLMGDPGLSIWTDVPEVMNATFSTTLNVGASYMHVAVTRAADAVPVKDALVVLWKGTETYSRGRTDENGIVDLPITVSSPGDLLLTITKHNHKPYLSTIVCVNATQMVSLCRYTLDDDNAGGTSGNGNSMVNPGETIDLPIYVKNFGSAINGNEISATMSCANPNITVVTATATFPTLLPGDSALSSVPYRISVAPTMGYNESALLTLDITASNVHTVSAIELVCHAGKVTFMSSTFNGAFNPGTTQDLSVTIKNTGVIDMSGVTGHLVSLSPFVSVDNANATFGNMPVNQQVSNSTNRFTLTSNTLTFRGHIASMMLITTSATGFVDTTQFTVSVGTAQGSDPTGPDGFGYYAYDNTDMNYETHPTFAYVDISTGLGSDLMLEDPGESTGISPVYSAVRRLPFSFKFYGVTYDTVTISANGWLAFGNQGYHDGWRNYRVPAMQAPGASIFPYWDDLQTNGASRGVWTYYDATNHQYIVQWKASGAFQAATLNFEVILRDTSEYPTLSGNGQILIQYNNVTMDLQGDMLDASGCTVGIQDARGTTGLPYVYVTTYSPGSATITNNRAILFTTDARALFGTVQGHITDAETDSPMFGVSVTIDGNNYHATTDNAGFYQIPNVLIGSYVVRAAKHAFNEAVSAEIIVELDSTQIVDLSLLHPEIDFSADSIHITVPTQPNQATFNILNGGNGPLDYSLSVAYAPSTHLDDAWDPLATINVSQLTHDFLILGCEFAADHWWVTGGSGPNSANQIYQFDLNGNLVQTLQQPTTSDFGWFDLAFDGANIYGSEDHTLTGINVFTGQATTPISSPLDPSRAIAYDPQLDHFWVADYTSDIFEISRQGTIIQQVTNEGANEKQITGMAWNVLDPDGYKLYIFSENGSGPKTTVSRMHPVSKQMQTVINLPVLAADRSAGCAITDRWNSTLVVFAGVLANSETGDRLGIFEMNFNTNWISVTPTQGTIPGAGSAPISVGFHPDMLRADFTYRVNLTIHSNVLDSSIVFPVSLTLLPTAVTEPIAGTLPTEYALHQNYPNPFNPSTEIRYDLKAGGHTKLAVYNVMGQSVATLVNEVQPAGVYKLTFDGSALGSGVYFYHLECNDFVQTSKMILMK